MRAIFISILLFMFSNLYSQNCSQGENVFQPGEKLTFKVSYSWMMLWLDVAHASMKVTEEMMKGQKTWHLKGYGGTLPNIDFFYRVDDVYETWVNPTDLRPIHFNRDVKEEDWNFKINYDFDWNNNIVYYKSKTQQNPNQSGKIKVPPCTYDVISITYLARNMDYDHLEVGDTIPVSIVLDRELHHLYFRYRGKEVKKVKGVGEFNSIHFSVQVLAGTVFSEDSEDLHVWVTDDKNRIPIYAESPLFIGSVKARIQTVWGIKYPLTSLIKEY